jgi:hypothetical protein
MKYLGIYHLSKMESSKSINYSTNMCPSDQVGPEGFLNSE